MDHLLLMGPAHQSIWLSPGTGLACGRMKSPGSRKQGKYDNRPLCPASPPGFPSAGSTTTVITIPSPLPLLQMLAASR